MFISLATYVVVRLLKYPKKVFLDKQREKIVTRYVGVIVFFTIVPSLFLSYNLIWASYFNTRVTTFVADELNFPNTQILSKKVTDTSDEVRIKYASQYAGSSNYWKNSIGMNKGLGRLNIIERKKEEEAAFAAWVAQDPARQEKYREGLSLLEKGYTSSGNFRKISTYLGEAFVSGAEIVRLARMIQGLM